MIKQDIIAEVVNETGLAEFDVRIVVDSVISTLTRALQDHEDINIRGFGQFKIVTRAARKARNINTGEPIFMSSRDVVVFTPGSDLSKI